MYCQNCKSNRLMSFSGKTADCFFAEINNKTHNGYVPEDLGIGRGDYIKGELCLDCGQLQGKFPLKKPLLKEMSLGRRISSEVLFL